MPPRHVLQLRAPASEYEPPLHASQLDAPVLECLPASQSVQASAPVPEYVPGTHEVQFCVPPTEYKPPAQLSQLDAPASDFLPASQSEHELAPVTDHRPDRHRVQLDAELLLHVPLSHLVHPLLSASEREKPAAGFFMRVAWAGNTILGWVRDVQQGRRRSFMRLQFVPSNMMRYRGGARGGAKV